MMRMKGLLSGLAAMGALVASAVPVVESVIVRQQWPWSDLIKVEYCLSGINNAANLSVQAWNGTEAIDTQLLRSAIVGDTIGVTDNVGSFQINPKVLFGNEKQTLESFRVKLTASDAVGDMDEVLYKIFDLTNGSCENVTRRGLLNGHYGTYETDYAKVGQDFGVSGFTTVLDEILIWTGVTNNIEYKTSKMVMRKIPAKNETFWMGAGDNHTYKAYGETKPRRQVTLTNDYWMAVFELTDGQFQCIITNTPGSTLTIAGSDKMRFTEETSRYVRPVNVPDFILRASYADWPTNTAVGAFVNNNSSLVGNLRKLTGVMFDLPTEACWEFAERAKNDKTFFCGMDTPDGNIHAKLARCTYNSNMGSSNYNKAEYLAAWTLADGGTAEVGSYPPNPWGLYDMAGNLFECCLDHYTDDPTVDYDYYTSIDPWGPYYFDAKNSVYATIQARLCHVGKGGCYWYGAPYMSSGVRLRAYTNNSGDPTFGARLCIRIDN